MKTGILTVSDSLLEETFNIHKVRDHRKDNTQDIVALHAWDLSRGGKSGLELRF
jgi:hypothetical protein